MMRKRVILASSALALATLLGVAFAGLPESTTIQSGTTETRQYEGQTFELTAVNIEAEVTFFEVTSVSAEGLVTRISGSSGSVTIRWVERNLSTTIELTPVDPEQLFGLEGGDGDKRKGRSDVK